ncbi:hypothetical protein ATZ33_13635 [Enterococcus silesiacus]|uniref:DUF2812 domain-containing protein n=1 Tax=Enterococcus silesiacus TaxID=332949 RepID=A0A0S3KDK7_9ENTE|nr:DUF2812 domain-containing protein [Enterococcus silesiacus]ALS02390.1 hypothetical protein ATZ33_13635 [Enterococcus silesiacus]OJG91366.1 hypothetical protein RV15_GL000822 [Enterococcus silesiacus]
MKKLKLFIDIKKEEQYLKEMAEQGWALVKYSIWGIYTFEKIAPKTLNYRIDYQTFKKKADYVAYLTLFEDGGWQQISGTKNSGFQFFSPLNSKNQELDIFSDTSSSNERYKRLYDQAIIWATLMILYFFMLQPSFENISSWYLTSSIWAYTGLQLFGMIIMQTFFLIIQIMPMMFFIFGAVYFTIMGTKTKKLIKKYETG